MRRQHIQQLAVSAHFPRISGGICFDPLGDVMRLTVLPRSEPEKHEMQMARTRTDDEQVYAAEIEHAALQLHLFPINRSLDRIDVHRVQRRPDLWQGACPRARVVDLRTEHEVWLSLDHQGIPSVAFLDTGERTDRESTS